MSKANKLSRWAASLGYLWAGLVVVIIVVALGAACSSQQVTAAEPPDPPAPSQEETAVATPEPTPTAPEATIEVVQHEAQAMAATPFQNTGVPPALSQLEEECVERGLEPLPSPGSPGVQGFWGSFREPMPPAPVWNPPGPKRVGLQAGHWRNNEVPRELGRLIGSGTSGGGKAEWEVNLDIARRAASILEGYGIIVDILPATVPPRYKAHAFVSIHADGDLSGALRGYKVARAGFSPIPVTDDALVEALYAEYGPATGLSRDDPHVSLRMVYYYAFNSRRYCHAVAPGVPAAIIEAGFLTNAADRGLLIGRPDAAAEGIARGVLAFLGVQEPIAIPESFLP